MKTGGTGILGILGVLFVGLKLTGHIDWSWWLVTLPFWGPLALFVSSIVVIAIGLIIKEICKTL